MHILAIITLIVSRMAMFAIFNVDEYFTRGTVSN